MLECHWVLNDKQTIFWQSHLIGDLPVAKTGCLDQDKSGSLIRVRSTSAMCTALWWILQEIIKENRLENFQCFKILE